MTSIGAIQVSNPQLLTCFADLNLSDRCMKAQSSFYCISLMSKDVVHFFVFQLFEFPF